MDAGAAARRIAELEAELAEARMSNDALRELMRDPEAGDPESLSNSQKAGLGERYQQADRWHKPGGRPRIAARAASPATTVLIAHLLPPLWHEAHD